MSIVIETSEISIVESRVVEELLCPTIVIHPQVEERASADPAWKSFVPVKIFLASPREDNLIIDLDDRLSKISMADFMQAVLVIKVWLQERAEIRKMMVTHESE